MLDIDCCCCCCCSPSTIASWSCKRLLNSESPTWSSSPTTPDWTLDKIIWSSGVAAVEEEEGTRTEDEDVVAAESTVASSLVISSETVTIADAPDDTATEAEVVVTAEDPSFSDDLSPPMMVEKDGRRALLEAVGGRAPEAEEVVKEPSESISLAKSDVETVSDAGLQVDEEEEAGGGSSEMSIPCC